MQKFKVTASALNLRSNPFVDDNVIDILPKDHIVEKLEEVENSNWWKVETILDGEKLEGYVASRFLGKTTNASVRTLIEIGGVSIKRTDGESAIFYESRMSINADGAPNAYNPSNTGIDFLDNAGYPGNWWALAVDRNGEPFVQDTGDPFPGYYVSTTALFDSSFTVRDPQRYVNSMEIPYIVLPGNGDFKQITGIQLGDFAVVYNRSNEKLVFAICADIGPKSQIGEGSIALSQTLGNDPFVRGRVRRGISHGIVYLVFSRSGNGKVRTISEINTEGNSIFEKWGGIERLRSF